MFHRASTRCALHDYRRPGWYFVTICTFNRRSTLGEISPAGVYLSPLGGLVAARWGEIARRSPFARPHDFVLMPDHLHGIIEIPWPVDGVDLADPARFFGPPQAHSLGVVINLLKGDVTQTAWQRGVVSAGTRIWQRGYHDRIIRGARHLDRVRAYIRDNPIRAASPR